MSQEVTVKVENALLDQILVGVHGHIGQKILTLALEANPGICETSVLPIGTTVIVPDIPDSVTNQPTIETVSLFD